MQRHVICPTQGPAQPIFFSQVASLDPAAHLKFKEQSSLSEAHAAKTFTWQVCPCLTCTFTPQLALLLIGIANSARATAAAMIVVIFTRDLRFVMMEVCAMVLPLLDVSSCRFPETVTLFSALSTALFNYVMPQCLNRQGLAKDINLREPGYSL